MIRLAFCAVGALLLSISFAKAEKPNILFIAIDDQNDWIGCLGGHPQIQTPHIDGLAARGTLFANAHCQAPLCNSSRTSLLTGLRPSTTGIHGLAPWFRDVDSLSELVTLPQYLRQNGYTTYSTGKIFHGGYGRRPKKDDEFDHLGPAASVGARPQQKLVETPNPHPLVDWGTFPHNDEDKGDFKVASWAVDTLQAKPQQPFFLSVGFFLPHVPCYATQKWFDLYPEDEVQLPPFMPEDRDDTPRFSWYMHWKLPEPRQKFLMESGEWRNLVRSYMACTSFVDSQVGRVLAALEEQGYADNTIVVVWSDHGWHLGEKGITGKNSLWDRSTRVPLIFAGPGVAIGGKCTQPVELLDIYPTLIDLCGLPQNTNLEGLSLTPQLQNAATKRDHPAITTHNQGNHAIRTQRWRYIRYADGSEELYDMQSDPQEINNLAGNAKLADVKKELAAWLPKVDLPAAPGSAHRILSYDGETAVWEGEVIRKDDPIPEL
ncbi:sulfatase [Blastopirellula sp. J2-11]|uniref:sulfatase n=1 Tax=Blastopirellula sp. J2-11 TaxID=2943192 RepID=UPI0021C8A320|nr:sulfatase [Blastopirellula sp. J2-11]UUO05441.1 sulfatase [Blastopirellula sp. J2-11]